MKDRDPRTFILYKTKNKMMPSFFQSSAFGRHARSRGILDDTSLKITEVDLNVPMVVSLYDRSLKYFTISFQFIFRNEL